LVTPMMLKVDCPSCGHVGVVAAESLPRSMTCSACGESRRVKANECRRVASRTTIIEWLCGAEAPRVALERSGDPAQDHGRVGGGFLVSPILAFNPPLILRS
jgi:hypothetical protein